ncbi:MAG: CHAT domain-containing protein [Nannocystaceae bacterium]
MLIERLEAAQALGHGDADDRDARARHDAAVDRILAAEARLLAGAPDDPARAQWQRARDDAERDAVQAWDAIADAAVAPALRGREGPPLATIQAALGDDELLLVYSVPRTLGVEGPQPLASPGWVLRIGRDHARAVPLPELDGLPDLAALWQGAIEARDGSDTRPAAGLYQRVLAPALAPGRDGIARLSIVPDGALHTLPWAALRTAPQGPVLGEQLAVSVVPSLTTWLHLRQQAPSAGDQTVLIAAPNTAASLGLPPLPHAAREAEAIADALAPATIVRDDAASRAWVLGGGLAHARVVHVAAHALVDDVHPERAAIVLAPGDGDDGLVHVRELAQLDLRGAIVTLASCRSAEGAALAREEPLGLARGLLLAGARAPWSRPPGGCATTRPRPSPSPSPRRWRAASRSRARCRRPRRPCARAGSRPRVGRRSWSSATAPQWHGHARATRRGGRSRRWLRVRPSAARRWCSCGGGEASATADPSWGWSRLSNAPCPVVTTRALARAVVARARRGRLLPRLTRGRDPHRRWPGRRRHGRRRRDLGGCHQR